MTHQNLFDEIIDRREYPTQKWNSADLEQHFGNADALPFWVADMDFPSPPAVVESLRQRAEHGIFGYEYRTDSYREAMLGWYKSRHGWDLNPDHIEQTPSVLNATTVIIDQHSEVGDGVIVQPPVFFEFKMVINANKRRLVKNPLKWIDNKYQMDFDDLEEKAADPRNKVMILCNPHNPVGRVWTRDELVRVGEICRRHNVLVISDEIHGDIVYSPHRYTPFASISDEVAQASVTCLSPAKTFNIAGMVDAMAVIANEDIRHRYHDFAHRFQINKTNVFTSAAVEAAYRDGGAWLDELLRYLQGNVDFLRTYFRENVPQVSLIEPEGTYLVWLNFTELGMDVKELAAFLAQEAGIATNPGYWFGREGAGYARMNIATPRAVLEEAMTRLNSALKSG